MESFTEIVETWGRRQLANDIGGTYDMVREWSRIDSIPKEHWKAVLAKAPDRGIDISPDLLIDLAARD